MASIYKTFLADDITTIKTPLHEAIPITGSIISGTYAEPGNAGTNIKVYGLELYESIYDYPYLSSSANHIMDLTVGLHVDSALSSSTDAAFAHKNALYNQMAQVLVGYDVSGNILKFDQDGDFAAGGTKMDSAFFIPFSRLLTKDEIKKGSFLISIGMGNWSSSVDKPCDAPWLLTIADTGAETDYRVNSPSGEYGILSASGPALAAGADGLVGLLYYQAGIAVLTASIFQKYHAVSAPYGKLDSGMPGFAGLAVDQWIISRADLPSSSSFEADLSGSNITASCDGFRHRICEIDFNNTTELNSTIYFCRVNHNDFNYSSNPTYLTGSEIRVKGGSSENPPITYPCAIGLYSSDNALLGVAKLSEPLRKSIDTELLLRVRTDF
jgi:hypothetical protein